MNVVSTLQDIFKGIFLVGYSISEINETPAIMTSWRKMFDFVYAFLLYVCKKTLGVLAFNKELPDLAG